jgi:hypothetical protein
MNEIDRVKNYSEYLTFRSFYTGFPSTQEKTTEIKNIDEAINFIRDYLSKLSNPAILLSGGMDSAILLPYMPKNTTAYTIFHDKLKTNEVEIAREYCDKYSIKHVAISINEKEYFSVIDKLIISKKMPITPSEPIIYLAAKRANEDGFSEIVTGAGADTKLGGFKRFRRSLSRKEYQKNLSKSYTSPEKILKKTNSLNHVFQQYLLPTPKFNKVLDKSFLKRLKTFLLEKNIIDANSFLGDIGVERFTFDNAINLAGCKHFTPYNQFTFDFDEKKNFKQPKYLIQEIYSRIYKQKAPKKLGLQKPTHMLKDFKPQNMELFKDNIDIKKMNYTQKYLIYSLERFETLRLEGKV